MTLTVRRALAADVDAMSAVLTASIVALCGPDHDGDAQMIASWTANKTPDGVRAMLSRPGLELLVAERDGAIAAVGAIAGDTISLNYVAPEHRFRGVSKALLMAMENRLRERGIALGRLVSTATARRFYIAAGWVETGPGAPRTGYPMRKDL